jgi:hypothetical protein
MNLEIHFKKKQTTSQNQHTLVNLNNKISLIIQLIWINEFLQIKNIYIFEEKFSEPISKVNFTNKQKKMHSTYLEIFVC